MTTPEHGVVELTTVVQGARASADGLEEQVLRMVIIPVCCVRVKIESTGPFTEFYGRKRRLLYLTLLSIYLTLNTELHLTFDGEKESAALRIIAIEKRTFTSSTWMQQGRLPPR